MPCHSPLSPESSFRHRPSWARAFAPQKCAVTECPRLAAVEYGERLCGGCALLALEFDTREGDALAEPGRLPMAVTPNQGDAGYWRATGDPAQPFRWEHLPGRIDAGVVPCSAPVWGDFERQWADVQLDPAAGVPEVRLEERRVQPPLAIAELPGPAQVSQPRIETGIAPPPAYAPAPLGAIFWLTLLGIGVVLKAVLR